MKVLRKVATQVKTLTHLRSTMNTPTPSRGGRASNAPIITDVSTQTISLRRPGSGVAAAPNTPTASQNLNTSVQGKVKSFAEENPNYMSIDLPSKFQFYTFKSVSACTLKGSHQAKLNRAYTQNRLRYVVEAMGATLEPGVSAFDLTPADFYFLMYWQKVNSFTKSPQIITTQCTDPTHVMRVKAQAKDLPEGITSLPEESLKIEQFLNSTTLETKYAEILDIQALREDLPRHVLGVETMRDVVELTEHMIDLADSEDKEGEDVEEYGWLASRASFLDVETTSGVKASLADRCKIVADMSVEETSALEKYMQVVTNYGVEEHATIKCKECGASKRVKISFDALTFLPGG